MVRGDYKSGDIFLPSKAYLPMSDGGPLFYRNNRITAEGAVIIGKGLSVNEALVSIKVGPTQAKYHHTNFM